MTVEEFNAQDPKSASLPWWPWILTVLMAAGVVLALGVYARQGWHMAMNQEEAADLLDVRSEVQAVRAELERLRSDAEALEHANQANRQRIMAVETEVQQTNEHLSDSGTDGQSENDQ